MFSHLKSAFIQEKIHISHFFQYVSAYAINKEQVNDLVEDIENALLEAKTTQTTQIVNQDGECCFHVTPNGYIILMLPWKMYEIIRD